MIEVKSPAKINLYLNIISKLDNGYHEIKSAFQIIDLCDVIKFYPSSNGICINSNEDIKLEENIVFKAAHSLNLFTNQKNSIQIELDKNIPLGFLLRISFIFLSFTKSFIETALILLALAHLIAALLLISAHLIILKLLKYLCALKYVSAI